LRLGIGMDYATGRAADRMLYLAEFARPRPAHGLLVDAADALDWPDTGVISLGGEMRAALVTRLTAAQQPEPLANPSPLPNRFKIILLTPAWFADGRQPAGGDWAGFFNAPAAADLQCVAAAVGRPQYLGGWDAARGGHKPLRGFVPPGSAFYLETRQPITPPAAFTETPPEEIEFDRQGFGAFVAAAWSWQENI
jgi:CRISPR-associated protein Cmr3